MIRNPRPRAAVVRLPGMNCEDETVRALEAAGLLAVIVGWDEPASALAGYDAYVLPGGFSYQDRVRAGAIAAKDARIEAIAERAAQGVPVLGICNGAQILVEAGLVPGADEDRVALALAVNRMPQRDGYHSRWVVLEARGGSLWTEAFAPGERVPMPMAHGEGCFSARDPKRLSELAARGQVPFAYAADVAGGDVHWPANPNGSEANAAGVTNARGNVLALMPHPERAERLYHVPLDLGGPWGDRRRRLASEPAGLDGPGPGHGLFLSLAWHLGVRRAVTVESA
ncbi:MAG: phosphoribosylformylglycinamidine synthase I [Candidatus Eiseniibacteriota bacterium]